MGFQWVLENHFYAADNYIGFVGAELPFNLTDVLAIQGIMNQKRVFSFADIYIGSKGHSASELMVPFYRKIMSYCFYILRRYYLGMRCKDPQGTVYLRSDILKESLHLIKARDYFFTTELIYWAELNHKSIIEVPIQMLPQARSSSVKILSDPLKGLIKIYRLKREKNFFLGGYSPGKNLL